MRKVFISMLLMLTAISAMAQDDLEYRMEIGAGAGLMSYEGDFNGSIVKNMQPAALLLARYNINPYMGLRVMGSYGKLKGNAADVSGYLPDDPERLYSFDRNLADLSLTYEYNFWPYGTGRDYRGARRLTPFVFAGIGGTYADGGSSSVFTANVPLGLGVKYKVGDRMNIGAEWAMHFSLSDKLDGVADPRHVASSGLFKNTDCYSMFLVTVSYSVAAKCRTCHNDNE